MQLVKYQKDGRVGFGVLRPEGIAVLGVASEMRGDDEMFERERLRAIVTARVGSTTHRYATEEVMFLPPIAQSARIFCIGGNYRRPGAAAGNDQSGAAYPSVFMRTHASVVGHREGLLHPGESKQFDYEGEFGVVIGRRGRRIPPEQAMDFVAGITLANEGTVRDWMTHDPRNATPGKNFDRSGSIGPCVYVDEGFDYTGPFTLTTRVNGELRQHGSSEEMALGFAKLIAYISRFCEVQPGDVVLTGSPAGAGARMNPPRWLVPGDTVEVHCRQIGTLLNRVCE